MSRDVPKIGLEISVERPFDRFKTLVSDGSSLVIQRHMVSVLQKAGWAIHRVPKPNFSATEVTPEQDRIQYVCGYNYMPGWLNVDIITGGPDNYLYVNLVEQHPFPDNHFRFAVCENFVEHVGQADSLVFFEEVHRTLRQAACFV